MVKRRLWDLAGGTFFATVCVMALALELWDWIRRA